MSSKTRAIVIGAGISGLLAARALADTYAEVVILERDTLPDEDQPRRGVPQGSHAHALLSGGLSALEQLFPGFRTQLTMAGVPLGDAQADLRYYINGRALRTGLSGLTVVAASRPTLERAIRRRVVEHPRITIRTGQTVTGLDASPAGDRIDGVRTDGEPVPADLVVDAGGRGRRSIRWLSDLGYPPVPEETISPGMSYVTRHFAYDPALMDGLLGAIVQSFPGQVNGGVVGREDHDRIVVGLQAMLGATLPTDLEAMAQVADRLAEPRISRVLRQGTPLGPATTMKFPVSVRRRYEQMRRFPDGYLIVGDALCHFNPIYAQGMTVAAQEALLLRELLRRGTTKLARRFFRRAARLVDTPWSVAASSDLRFPQIEGRRPPGSRLVNAYLSRYYRAASRDATLAAAFIRVANLVDPPTGLLSPAAMARVAMAARVSHTQSETRNRTDAPNR